MPPRITDAAGTSTFASGSVDNTAGGIFAFTFNGLRRNVRERDNASRVNTTDASNVKSSLNAAATTVAVPPRRSRPSRSFLGCLRPVRLTPWGNGAAWPPVVTSSSDGGD